MCNVPQSINMMVLGVKDRDWEWVGHHVLGKVERWVLRGAKRKSSKGRKVEVAGSAIKIILTVTTICALHQRLNSSQAHLKIFFGGVQHHTACRILVPWPRIELMLPALEALSLKHWTIREVPRCLVAKLYLTVLRPHWLLSPSLLCPWDFPGKNTGVSCHSFWVEVRELLNILQWVG